MRLRVKMEAEQIVRAHRDAERRKTDAEGVRQAHLDQIRFQFPRGAFPKITPPSTFSHLVWCFANTFRSCAAQTAEHLMAAIDSSIIKQQAALDSSIKKQQLIRSTAARASLKKTRRPTTVRDERHSPQKSRPAVPNAFFPSDSEWADHPDMLRWAYHPTLRSLLYGTHSRQSPLSALRGQTNTLLKTIWEMLGLGVTGYCQWQQQAHRYTLDDHPKMRTAFDYARYGRGEEEKMELRHLRLIWQPLDLPCTQLIWQPFELPCSLLKLDSLLVSSDVAKLVERVTKLLFTNIRFYMKDKYDAQPAITAYHVVSTCLGEDKLRDEIYAQLVKQTTQNPNPESTLQGFRLLYLCMRSFLPTSPIMLDILNSHLAATTLQGADWSTARLGWHDPAHVAYHCYNLLSTGQAGSGALPSMRLLRLVTDGSILPERNWLVPDHGATAAIQAAQTARAVSLLSKTLFIKATFPKKVCPSSRLRQIEEELQLKTRAIERQVNQLEVKTNPLPYRRLAQPARQDKDNNNMPQSASCAEFFQKEAAGGLGWRRGRPRSASDSHCVSPRRQQERVFTPRSSVSENTNPSNCGSPCSALSPRPQHLVDEQAKEVMMPPSSACFSPTSPYFTPPSYRTLSPPTTPIERSRSIERAPPSVRLPRMPSPTLKPNPKKKLCMDIVIED
eukprot:g51721.t1